MQQHRHPLLVEMPPRRSMVYQRWRVVIVGMAGLFIFLLVSGVIIWAVRTAQSSGDGDGDGNGEACIIVASAQASEGLRSQLFPLTAASEWTGADEDTSLWLYTDSSTNQQVYLWLFGDSFVGSTNTSVPYDAANNGRVWSQTLMPHSTVGLVTTVDAGGDGVVGPVEIFTKRNPVTSSAETMFVPSNASAPYYLWVVQGVSNSTTALLFGFQVVLQSGGLGFGIVGTELLVVDSVNTLKPTDWQPRSMSMGSFSNTELMWTTAAVYYGGAAGKAAAAMDPTGALPPLPSSSMTIDDDGGGGGGDSDGDSNTTGGLAVDSYSFVYIFGQLQIGGSALNTATVLARIPFDDLAAGNLQEMQFYSCTVFSLPHQCAPAPKSLLQPSSASSSSSSSSSSSNAPVSSGTARWVKGALPSSFRVLFNPGTPETTVYYDAGMQRWVCAVVQAFSSTISIYSAPSILGPYCSTPAYTIPSPWGDQTNRYFSYAAKMHPELKRASSSSSPNDLIFSYVTNSFNVSDLFGPDSTQVYIPRFVSATVEV